MRQSAREVRRSNRSERQKVVDKIYMGSFLSTFLFLKSNSWGSSSCKWGFFKKRHYFESIGTTFNLRSMAIAIISDRN
jgi:hypothetical protein